MAVYQDNRNVLNALWQSEVKHRDKTNSPLRCFCSAQRLMAIRGKTPETLHSKLCMVPVLNALWQSEVKHIHPRLYTQSEIRAQRLMAIRGKTRKLSFSLSGRVSLCSTPYGNQR